MIDYRYFEGGLTDTPEVRYTPNGRGVTTFTLAQSDSRKDEAGEWETTANCYLRVSLWDSQRVAWTEALAGLSKGTKLVVRGKLVTNKWQDKEGNTRSQLEVQAFHAYIDAAAGAQAPQQQQGNGGGQSNWGAPATTGGFGQQAPKDEEPPF